jgi:hypothetical protein
VGLQMGFGRVVVVVGLVFVITLAAVVGSRMSAEAMAVVVGVVCGVAAGIPTSVLLLLALGRRDRQPSHAHEHSAQYGGSPPVVVIQGGAPQALPPSQYAGYWPAVTPGKGERRQFQVVGDEELAGDPWG